MRLLLLFIVLSFKVYSQDSISNQIGLVGGMNRNDLSGGLQYLRIKKSTFIISSLECGIKTTFFQTRFFPRIGLGLGYHFINRNKFHSGPFVSYYYSALKVNNSSHHIHQWNELLIGNRLEIGSKIKFTSQVSLGIMNERFYNELSDRKTGVTTLGYYGNIGIAYEL